MRILHILDELKPSGAEAMLNAAGPFWQKNGVRSDILATGRVLGAYATTLNEAGYDIYHIPFVPSCRFVKDIYKFIASNRYDAVHIHPEKGSFWYAGAAFLAGNRRIIRTIHNVFPFSKILRMERYVQRWIMRQLLSVKMVAISRSVAAVEWEKYSNVSTLIPNWFDSQKIKPADLEQRARARRRLDLPNDAIVFTSIGGCWSYKNHSAIIEAMALLPNELPAMYLHVGQEAPGAPERMMADARQVSSRCRFLGIVPDTLDVLHASDVYVMPSHFEGFGVAAVEAMGAGVPAILSDVPGLRDFKALTNDICWVAPSPQALAGAMKRFFEMTDFTRREIGLRLSAMVHGEFAVERGAAAYLQLYGGESGLNGSSDHMAASEVEA